MFTRKPCKKALSLALSLALCLGLLPSQAQAAPVAPSVTAGAAIVIEASTGRVLYEKNADTGMYPASLTKVMTAYLIYEEIYAGNLSLDSPITITPAQAVLSRDSKFSAYVPLESGSVHSLETMLKLILLPSASAACVIMAENISGTEEVFVQRMNETAKRMGIDATYTNTYSTINAKLTPRAQARLIQQFVSQFPEVLNITTTTSVTADGRTYSTTNKLLLPSSAYFYEGVQGFKTGTNAVVGSNLCTTAIRGDDRIITVVCGSSGDSARYNDTTDMLNYGFASLEYLKENGKYYYNDNWVHPASTQAYETFRLQGVNLQSRNGWVRPGDQMTQGEFASTLVTALEKAGYYQTPTVQLAGTPQVSDLSNYFEKDAILRGIVYGILPWSGGNFNPDQPLTVGYLQECLLLTAQALNLSYGSQDDSQDDNQNTSAAKEGISFQAIQTGTIFLLALPFPEVAIAAYQGQIPEAESVPQTPEPEVPTIPDTTLLLRGEAVLALDVFLQQV